MTEREPTGFEAAPQIGEVVVPVPGLIPEMRDNRTGEVVSKGNIDSEEMQKKIDKVLEENSKKGSWFSRTVDAVRNQEKSAIYVEALGAIVVFVAAGAGVEFGVRHGKDIRALADKLRKPQKVDKQPIV